MANQDIALMAHLMRRAGFGATREELEALCEKGYENVVEELLNPTEEALDRFEMMRYQPWTWRPAPCPVWAPPNGCGGCSTPAGPWKRR